MHLRLIALAAMLAASAVHAEERRPNVRLIFETDGKQVMALRCDGTFNVSHVDASDPNGPGVLKPAGSITCQPYQGYGAVVTPAPKD